MDAERVPDYGRFQVVSEKIQLVKFEKKSETRMSVGVKQTRSKHITGYILKVKRNAYLM